MAAAANNEDRDCLSVGRSVGLFKDRYQCAALTPRRVVAQFCSAVANSSSSSRAALFTAASAPTTLVTSAPFNLQYYADGGVGCGGARDLPHTQTSADEVQSGGRRRPVVRLKVGRGRPADAGRRRRGCHRRHRSVDGRRRPECTCSGRGSVDRPNSVGLRA